jgi:hypothetical protein
MKHLRLAFAALCALGVGAAWTVSEAALIGSPNDRTTAAASEKRSKADILLVQSSSSSSSSTSSPSTSSSW